MNKDFYGLVPIDLQGRINQAVELDRRLNKDFIVYFITLLTTQYTVYDCTDRRLKLQVFDYREVALMASRLKAVYHDYHYSVQWLLGEKLIYRKGYSKGESSFRYCLQSRYQFQKLQFVQLMDCKMIEGIKDQLKPKINRGKYNFIML